MSNIVDINWLYHKYYGDNPQLRRIVTIHSKMVAKKALSIAEEKKLPLEDKEIYIAAMLHDIGVVKCKANDIYAFGELPYLQHGIEGKKILEAHGLHKYANICETHTGTGLSSKEIKKNKLPLPIKDMLPKTLLEKLICYADKFYSKSGDLTKEKTIENVIVQMKKYGEESLKRFMDMHVLFNTDGN